MWTMQSQHHHRHTSGEGGGASSSSTNSTNSAHQLVLRRRILMGFTAVVLLAFTVGLSTLREDEDATRGSSSGGKKKSNFLIAASDGLNRQSRSGGMSPNPTLSSMRLGRKSAGKNKAKGDAAAGESERSSDRSDEHSNAAALAAAALADAQRATAEAEAAAVAVAAEAEADAQLAEALTSYSYSYSSNNSTKKLRDAALHPTNLGGRCVTIRFASNGKDEDGDDVLDTRSLTVDEAVRRIRDGRVPTVPSSASSSGDEGSGVEGKDDSSSDAENKSGRTMRIGLEFVEHPDDFTSLTGSNPKFHLFHFLEFMVISASTLHRLESAFPQQLGYDVNATWIYAPHVTGQEICLGYDGMNCIIADLVLNGHSPYKTEAEADGKAADPTTSSKNNIHQSFPTHGLEVNDEYTRSLHPAHRGAYAPTTRRRDPSEIKKKSWPRPTLPDPMPSESQRTAQRHNELLDKADAVILISRPDCNRYDDYGTLINKIWAKFISDFPALWWSRHVWNGMRLSSTTSSTEKEDTESTVAEKKKETKVVTVGYIDRQNTDRAMPDADHEWLVSYLFDLATSSSSADKDGTSTSTVEFLHLHMEDHTSLEQISLASRCDVLIGLHGNGLSHQLWMKPKSALVEIYWNHRFHFDYPNMAEMMKHDYLGLFNGRILDNVKDGVMNHHDQALLDMEHELTDEERKGGALPKEAREAIRRLIHDRL